MSEKSVTQIRISSQPKKGAYCISKLPASELRTYLEKQLGLATVASFSPELPESYNQGCSAQYGTAFQRYLSLACGEPVREELKEEDIFFLAVVAYTFKHTRPLRDLDAQLNQLSDRYYWLYLAASPYFYSTMEIEMFRRRVSQALPLTNLAEVKLAYHQERRSNILERTQYTCHSDSEARFFENSIAKGDSKSKPSPYITTNLNAPNEALLHYESSTLHLCKLILEMGGVIAGGFVNSLLNPVYQATLNDSYNPSSLPPAFHDPSSNFARVEIRKKQCFKKDPLTDYSADTPREEELKAFLDREVKDFDREESVFVPKQFWSDSFGACALKYRKAGDIDVFVIGPDYLATSRKIVANLLSQAGPHRLKMVYCSEWCTSFAWQDLVKIQIIKRAYSSVEEILAGFDLNSCRAALTLDERGQWKYLAPRAYIDAVQYGINVVVPCWQSETYNTRLYKYYAKGYEAYLPGEILTRFELRSKFATEKAPLGTLAELIKYRNSKYLWLRKDLSDYTSDSLYFLLDYRGEGSEIKLAVDERRKLILEGKLEPQVGDLCYHVNCVLKECLKYYHRKETRFTVFCLLDYVSSRFWRVTEPGSQFTGSFNPTNTDYLLSLRNAATAATPIGNYDTKELMEVYISISECARKKLSFKGEEFSAPPFEPEPLRPKDRLSRAEITIEVIEGSDDEEEQNEKVEASSVSEALNIVIEEGKLQADEVD